MIRQQVLRGTVRGNVIELEGDAGISDGERVEILLRRVSSHDADQSPGDGLLRTEGARADDSEWDSVMDKIQQSRRDERRPQWGDE